MKLNTPKNKAAVALGRLGKNHKKTMTPAALLARRQNAIAGWKTRRSKIKVDNAKAV